MIVNLITRRVYIGSALRLGRRKVDHFKTLRAGTHHNSHLQRSFNKHGDDSFEFSVIEFCSVDSLIIREQHYIDLHGIGSLYNIMPIAGSSLGRVATAETRKKMSENRGRCYGDENNFYGKTHTVETRQKIRSAATGRQQTSQTVEKRMKAIEAKYGARSATRKAVLQVDTVTGEIIGEFDSAADAAIATGATSPRISQCCTGKKCKARGKEYVAKTAGGYGWKFRDWTIRANHEDVQ